jgi:DNA-binding transcriptional ArsR family regulator
MTKMNPRLNACFAALSDPTRRSVVEALVRRPATVSALAAPHAMALPTFMKHLSVLEKCGLVRSDKTGRVRTCFVEPAPLLEVQGWMEWQRIVFEKQLDERDQIAMPLDN